MDLLRHMRHFVAVGEEQHFGRAAERLNMAQPPLSQQIRRLEDELGVQLFARTTRRVELTQAGVVYLDRARAVLAAVDAAAHESRRVAAGVTGHVVIGCVGSVTYSLVPALSRRVADELPGIDLSFRGEMLAADQVDALRDGSIDLALLRPPVADGSLTVTPLRRDRLIALLPKGHPLTGKRQVRVTDLRDEPLIVHSADRRSTMFGVVRRLCRDAGFDPTVRHEVGETSTLVTLVAGGLGAAIAPEQVRSLGLDGVVHRPLVRPATSVELALAYRADRQAPHLTRVMDVIHDLV